MGIVQINASLVASSDATSSITATYAIASTLPGDSTVDPWARYIPDAIIEGASSIILNATVIYASTSSMIGDSVVTESPTATYAIVTTMEGEASVVPTGKVVYSAVSSMLGDSVVTESPTVTYAVVTTMAGESSIAPTGKVVYSANTAMVGGSVVIAAASEFDTDNLSFPAESALGASANLTAALHTSLLAESALGASANSNFAVSTAILGNSFMTFVPAGVTVTNVSRGPQIPVSARPLTVPTIRISPPAPFRPSYSVGSPLPNRRREGL